MTIRPSMLAAATLVLASAALSPPAQALTITRGFSGLWLDRAVPTRALGAEVVETATGKELHAFWIGTDAGGRPQWVRAKGAIRGNRAVLDAVAAGSSVPWGKLTVSFDDCSKGSVALAPIDRRLAAGQVAIVRAAADASGACTGGISDDRIVTDRDRIVEYFENTGVVQVASGKARFEERSGRTDFKVEAEDLPLGDYSLRVGGVERATVEVRSAATGTEGEVEFRSPVEPGKILLDFDPRGAMVEIVQGDTVFLRTKFGSGEGGAGDDDGGVPGGSYAYYEMHVETANDGPELQAKLEERPNRADFSVELEDVAAGFYALDVGGIERGTIEVAAVARGTEGEIEFRDPPEAGHFLLDFDPRGQIVQVRRGGAVVLSGMFPTQPSEGDDGGGNDDPPGDDNGGGGNDDPPGDDNGGGGNDDPPGDDNGGGGNDDPPGDDNGGGGNDDPPGDDNGGHGGDDDDDHGGHGGHGGDDDRGRHHD